MSVGKILLIVLLILLLIGAFPGVGVLPAAWGYGPFSIVGVVLLVLLVLLLLGKI